MLPSHYCDDYILVDSLAVQHVSFLFYSLTFKCAVFSYCCHVHFVLLVLVKVLVFFVVRRLFSYGLWPIMMSSNYARLNSFHGDQSEMILCVDCGISS